MDQFEYINDAGIRTFAQSPQELAQQNPDGLQRGGRNLNIEQQLAHQQALRGGADERQMAYLQQLQMELARSKMEKEQADLAYNPTMSELGVGGRSNQPLDGGGTLANINQQGGSQQGPFGFGPQGSQSPSYTNISSADKAYDPSESQATLPPDMRLQDLRRVAENTRHLPNNIQEQILGKLLGVQPESVQRHVERLMAQQAARQDKKEAAAAVVENRKRTFQSTNAQSMFNKETGEPLSGFDTSDMDPDEIEKQFVFLRPEQRKDKEALDKFQGMIKDYESLVKDIGYTTNGALSQPQRLAMAARRRMGDTQVQRLDSLNAQITQMARAFGGDSRVAVQELAMLGEAVPGDDDTVKSANEKIAVMKDFYSRGVKAMGLPWQKKQQVETEDTGDPAKLSARNQAVIGAMSKAEQAGTLPPQQAAILQELRRRGIID